MENHLVFLDGGPVELSHLSKITTLEVVKDIEVYFWN